MLLPTTINIFLSCHQKKIITNGHKGEPTANFSISPSYSGLTEIDLLIMILVGTAELVY